MCKYLWRSKASSVAGDPVKCEPPDVGAWLNSGPLEELWALGYLALLLFVVVVMVLLVVVF